jgi:hypothetical protein
VIVLAYFLVLAGKVIVLVVCVCNTSITQSTFVTTLDHTAFGAYLLGTAQLCAGQKGEHMNKNEQRPYWSGLWRAAKANMPALKKGRAGQATLLRRLLGYRHLDPNGRNCAGQHCFTATSCGYAPRDPHKRRVLTMLAGQHGRTIARVIAYQRGIDVARYDW